MGFELDLGYQKILLVERYYEYFVRVPAAVR